MHYLTKVKIFYCFHYVEREKRFFLFQFSLLSHSCNGGNGLFPRESEWKRDVGCMGFFLLIYKGKSWFNYIFSGKFSRLNKRRKVEDGKRGNMGGNKKKNMEKRLKRRKKYIFNFLCFKSSFRIKQIKFFLCAYFFMIKNMEKNYCVNYGKLMEAHQKFVKAFYLWKIWRCRLRQLFRLKSFFLQKIKFSTFCWELSWGR